MFIYVVTLLVTGVVWRDIKRKCLDLHVCGKAIGQEDKVTFRDTAVEPVVVWCVWSVWPDETLRNTYWWLSL